MSMKNYNDTIGNRVRDLPACSAVSQPTAPLHAPPSCSTMLNVCFLNKELSNSISSGATVSANLHAVNGQVYIYILLLQIINYRRGVAQRVGRSIALFFHDRGTRRG